MQRMWIRGLVLGMVLTALVGIAVYRLFAVPAPFVNG